MDATVGLGLPPPTSPPIMTLPPPATPEASIVAPLTAIFSPVTWMVPPLVPAALPAAESVPETLTVCVGAPAGFGGSGRRAQHNHAVVRADGVCLDHAGGVDDRVDDLARRRRGQFDAAAIGLERALILDQRTERLPGGDILHRRRNRVGDAERDQLVAIEIECEAVAGGERNSAQGRGDGAGIAHARAPPARQSRRSAP